MSAAQVHALIPAAGRGSRFGGAVLKQYLPVAGKAVIVHAIRAFQFHPLISSITVVLAADDQWFAAAVDGLSAAVETVVGGSTRAHSVRNGLRFIASRYPDAEWVLVHDAARPCLPPDCLDSLLEQGLRHPDGGILAVPVGDTLKSAGAGRVIAATVSRDDLWAAQTPQLFRLSALAEAMDAAERQGRELADEASAMEFAGFAPKLVMGSAANIKITHPCDLAIAEAWLNRPGVTS